MVLFAGEKVLVSSFFLYLCIYLWGSRVILFAGGKVLVFFIFLYFFIYVFICREAE